MVSTPRKIVAFVHILFIFLCLIALASINEIVKEHKKRKHYIPASCITTEMIEIGDKKCNNNAWYPCVQVLVKYTTFGNNQTREGILYSTTNHKFHDGLCSEVSCKKKTSKNEKKVFDFVVKWTVSTPQPFICYYNEREPHQVIGEFVYGHWRLFHQTFWPCFLIVCLIASGAYCVWGTFPCCRRNVDGDEPSHENDVELQFDKEKDVESKF